MKTCVLIILLLFALPAAAQTPSAPGSATSPVVAFDQKNTATDTVRALQNLFKNRRTRGALLLGSTGALIVTSNIVSSNNQNNLLKGTDGVIVATATALINTVPLWVVGISQEVRFSKKKEQQVIDDFTTTHRLNPKILKRLKPGFLIRPSGR